MKRLLVAFALALPIATSGCGTTCDRDVDGEEIVFDEGIRTQGEGFKTYQTSAWAGPLLHFPTGRRYVLEHGLGAPPVVVMPYVAFQERPDNLSVSAGNQTVIEAVDANVIVVRNDTCAEFFLLVVATASGVATDAGAADATGD